MFIILKELKAKVEDLNKQNEEAQFKLNELKNSNNEHLIREKERLSELTYKNQNLTDELKVYSYLG